MIIFCSDIDRTLVYSNKFVNMDNSDRCQIVTQRGSYSGFMTNYTLSKLRELCENEKFMFIPATTRTESQYDTLTSIKELAEYAIVLNGARVLRNGKIDEEYEEIMSKTLAGYEYYQDKIWSQLKDLEEDDKIFKSVKNSGAFIYGKFYDEYECRKFLIENIDSDLFYYSMQGDKYYIFPQPIRKENALKYLIKKISSKHNEFETIDVVVAGDGDVDIGMFECATKPSYFIINKQKEINLCDFKLQKSDILRIIKGKGIDSPEVILYDIENYFKKGEKKQ